MALHLRGITSRERAYSAGKNDAKILKVTPKEISRAWHLKESGSDIDRAYWLGVIRQGRGI